MNIPQYCQTVKANEKECERNSFGKKKKKNPLEHSLVEKKHAMPCPTKQSEQSFDHLVIATVAVSMVTEAKFINGQPFPESDASLVFASVRV